MTHLLIPLGVFCAGVGVVAWWANPRRLTNRVFAAVALLVGCWMWSIAGASRAGEQFAVDHVTSPVWWLKANGVIAGITMWVLSLLTYSIIWSPEYRRAVIRRLTLLSIITVVYIIITCSDLYIPAHSTPSHHERGIGYVFCVITALTWQTWMLFEIGRQIRRHSGIRRVELQFLSQNLTVATLLMLLVAGTGNWLELPWLKRGTFLIFFAAFVIAAWALTLHRVFDARQIFLSLLQRVAVVSAVVGGALAVQQILTPAIAAPWNWVFGIAACAWPGFWLDRQSRSWLRLDGVAAAAKLRTAIDSVTRTEPNPERLIVEFERVLRDHFGTTFATLMFDRGTAYAGVGLELTKGTSCVARVLEAVWITPESALRRGIDRYMDELSEFLTTHNIGVLVITPHPTPSPSMIVALGVKSNGWAFTYPEVRHLQTAAELIDNILARARLTTEAALKAKIEHLALMSRGLAHDLKNLITPISSYLVHTTGRYEPGSAEHEVHLAARRSVRLITDYVRETLFFANRLTPKFEHVTLHTICRTAMEACAQRAEWRAVAMHSEIGENTRIWADGVLLQRVLINLLTNAIDASSAGASIFIKATITDSNGTHIEVIDEGMGIASDALKRIFEPFYTTKVVSDESRGFGLGLTICEKIVKLHNGCLSVHSTPGVGTTVRIDLPSNEGTMPVHQQMEAVPQIQN